MDTIPSTPDPDKVAQIAGVVRALLALLAGVGIAVPTLTDTQLSAFVSAAMLVTSVVVWIATAMWSWVQKQRAAQHTHATAVASAQAASPVQPARGAS